MATYSPLQAFMVGTREHDRQMQRIRRLGLSERQLELNRAWSFFCTTQYESRSITWDGRKRLTPLERESAGRSAVLPPGFYDAAGAYDELPLDMRCPTAPYHIVRVVVHRFTGLLFSARMHPKIGVSDQPEVQTWIEQLVKACRLWIRFAYARNFGGGMGSVAMSFRFRNGRPLIDVHDARWCTPTFIDVSTGEIAGLEIRYTFPREERDPKDGVLKQVWYWYRRTIDAQRDVIFKPALVGDGDEPAWIEETVSEHGFGECPAVWVRNTQTDDMDGEPDCHGEYAAQEAIDRLLSQADQGAVENADPTLEVDSDELKVEQLRKGSRHAIKLEKGGSAKYIEASGSGIEIALKVADVHRRNFLEVVQCVLDSEETGGQMTATEVERRRESMHGRGDLFREQYGEHGIRPLLGKLIRAVIAMRRTTTGPSANYDHATGLRLVPRVMPGAADLPPGLAEFTDDMIELQWPEWVQRGATDATAAAGAVATARSAQVLDRESAVAYLAPYFHIDDPAEALRRLESEGGATDGAMMGELQAAGARPGGQGPPAPSHAPPSPPAPPDATGSVPPGPA